MKVLLIIFFLAMSSTVQAKDCENDYSSSCFTQWSIKSAAAFQQKIAQFCEKQRTPSVCQSQKKSKEFAACVAECKAELLNYFATSLDEKDLQTFQKIIVNKNKSQSDDSGSHKSY